ncbi:MAG: NAD(+)/NADH kinase [Coriobacteriales bacterium]|jgi:NAD+ kinase|nr:NAD(+)/NADH kinase [Coriobacteriales bacterium]
MATEVLFVVPTINAKASQAAAEAQQWLAERQVHSSVVDADQLLIGSSTLQHLVAHGRRFALVCALGGDGTVLRATRVAALADIPLIGINFGSLGFLTGAHSASLLPALEAFLQGRLTKERRVMLSANISFSDGSHAQYQALNEIVLGRQSLGRDIRVRVAINDHALPEFRADGMVVATATGSTAYALSAGGSLLTPDQRGLCVVPISAHNLRSVSFVCGPEDTISLFPLARSGQRAVAYIDGQMLANADGERDIVSVLVKRAQKELLLLNYDAPDFYAKVVRLLSGMEHEHVT